MMILESKNKLNDLCFTLEFVQSEIKISREELAQLKKNPGANVARIRELEREIPMLEEAIDEYQIHIKKIKENVKMD